ncbi:1,4-dihydroxy-2-naphthoate polyprenyltransferase [Iamia sp. SCSIO 61187]|uniref:1,4-dihydroxy-2-naphthoate polyprenyltransferase n=1 Tax=Iamia sp. SCSIO 61187 TaxID=2722752 RepID=UPI001C62FA5E|nr:1,4-dihydroxy-2-naphthoate polyprenyltransferase [Iamia sp. SCSIO 61187]QYG93376.1 1,4-dihydroxy-2-naphthoate polyprenyltransferase [Iamia sp. SCSIO 61187]
MTAPAPTATPRGWRLWLAGARPRTLPAAVVPVAVGTACAVGRVDGGLIWWRAGCALVVALALQVATNYANDYSDGIRGTDDDTRRVGPVRLVGQGLARPGAVKRAAAASFGVAGVAGAALAAAVGPELLVVGVLAIAAGWFYTGGPRPYGYAGLGEAFVFTFFGVVATAGSTYVQVEGLDGLGLAASVPVGFLATALLVTNNLRDIPGDNEVGKRTLAVRLGDRRTRSLFVALVVGAFVAVPLVAGLGGRPAGAAALVAVLLAQKPVVAVLSGARGPALIPVLAATGRVQLAFGALFAAGLALGG